MIMKRFISYGLIAVIGLFMPIVTKVAAQIPPSPPSTPPLFQSGQKVSLSGWFTVRWSDAEQAPRTMEELYFLTDEHGQSTQILLSQALVQALGGILALNKKWLTIEGEWARVSTSRVERSVLEAQSIQLPSSVQNIQVTAVNGPQPWISILCKFADVATTPQPVSYFQGMYSSSYPGLDHYWREVSYNHINVVGSGAVGWFTLPHPKSYYNASGSTDLSLLFDDCTAVADASVYFPNYVGINLMFNDTLTPNYAWGGGHYKNLDGISKIWNTTWEPPWGYADVTVIAHEMGHGFGLPHSGGDGQEGKNPWDIMGDGWTYCFLSSDPTYGCLAQHTISYHKDILGWIPAGQRYMAAGGTTTITLEQLALPQTGNYKMAQIPINGSSTHFYTIEVRRKVGYDVKLPGQAVVIHDVDTTRLVPAQVIDADHDGDTGDDGAMWEVGETFKAGYDISVSVNSATASGFVVTITIFDTFLYLPIVIRN